MAAQNISLRTAIYKQQQFEPARNGSLTNYLTGIAEQSSSIINQLKNNGAYGAVDESRSIMDAYLKNGTKRVIPGFGDTRDDFDYLYFMTPKAFENLNMDKEKCVTYTYTYKWTTSSGTAREDSHIFFVNWVKNRADRTSYRKKGEQKMTLQETIEQIHPLSKEAMDRAKAHWDGIAKPLHSLGKLEDVLIQIAGITGKEEISIEKEHF